MTRRRLLLALAAVLLVVGLWQLGRRMREPRVPAPVASERRGAPALVPGAGKDELAGAPGALALVAGPRGAIAGRVSDPAGGAIEGAVVCATGQSDELSAAEMQDPFCVQSDKTGAYEIAGLLPARYGVDASAAEHQPGRWMPERRESIQLSPGQRRVGVDLILRRGGVLVRGRAKGATLLRTRRVETRSSASTRPIVSESTIATNAIWMLIQNPRSRNQKLFPEKSHSQLSGSKR